MRWWIGICVGVVACWHVGSPGAAVFEGTSGGDVLVGSTLADQMYGWGGADTIRALSGSDMVSAGAGADTIECGRGHDSAQGNGGNDLILCDADDGKPDIIDCAHGENDTAFWRVPGTTIRGCENVYQVTGSGD
jgi:Ca2+-binding RTX toxin-like protein